MSKDKDSLPGKKEERDPKLTKFVRLAPLLKLVVQVLELILKALRIIN